MAHTNEWLRQEEEVSGWKKKNRKSSPQPDRQMKYLSHYHCAISAGQANWRKFKYCIVEDG